MQEGLHVGLAAWVGAQQNFSGGFVSWPAAPVPTQLTALEAVQTMADVSRAAEFARMVNLAPRKGGYAEPFGVQEVLWDTHRELLARMQFATRPWNAQEDADFAAARARLWTQSEMTPEFKLYLELRIAYTALEEAGADATQLAIAHAAWTVNGHKVEIEAALATINRLSRRSSLPEAEAERLSLEPDRLLATDDSSYAATSFAPLSAVREDTWLRAEVTIEDLGRAVGDAEPRGKWAAWRGAREGTIRFIYTVLELQRPWFTRALYEADDWQLAAGALASGGDGIVGEIPAYVRSVYVARLEDVSTFEPTPPVIGEESTFERLSRRDLLGLRRARAHGEQAISPVVRDGVLPMLARPDRAEVAMSPVIRDGVVPTLARDSIEAQHARPVVPGPRVPWLAADAREARFGRIEKVTMNNVHDRLALANAVIVATEANRPLVVAQPEPQTTTPFVVGFGCAALPSSPKPNPSYQWT